MNCRHCRAELSASFIDLGSAPPSNAYLSRRRSARARAVVPAARARLRPTAGWSDRGLRRRDALFASDYAYFSSFSSSWLEHAEALRRRDDRPLRPRRRVACGRGRVERRIPAADTSRRGGIPCLGIEPTASTAAAARAQGHRGRRGVLRRRARRAARFAGPPAELIAANNVLAHVPDINDFVAGFARLLKPQGVATFEFPHLCAW